MKKWSKQSMEPVIWNLSPGIEAVDEMGRVLDRLGCAVVARPEECESKPTLAMTWGVRQSSDEIHRCREARVPLMIFENGFLGRPVTWDAGHTVPAGGYMQVVWAKINQIRVSGHEPTRLTKVLAEMGVEYQTERQIPHGNVLVCGQVPDDAQHQQGPRALALWLRNETVKACERHGAKRVVFRPHPMAPDFRMDKLPAWIEVTVRGSDQLTLWDEFKTTACVVTYNSNAGVEAMIAGVPVMAHPGAHYAAFANGPSRMRWDYLTYLAGNQFSLVEIQSGLALQGAAKSFVPVFNRLFPIQIPKGFVQESGNSFLR